jgi:quercetin dioxygenase-like cupin family protein
MPVVRAADARREDGADTKRAGLATPSLGAAELIVCSLDAALGWHGAPHSHDREEVVVVTGGTGTAMLDGVTYAVEAGDTVIVPAGVVHSFAAGADGLQCITCEPAGIRTFDPEGDEKEARWTMR